MRHQIDQIISDAVEFGILFRHSGTIIEKSLMNNGRIIYPNSPSSSDNVYDLSCLSFPVARAACRYILMKRILPLQLQVENSNATTNVTTTVPRIIPDLVLITGSGLQHRLITAVNKDSNSNLSSSSSNSIGIHQPRSMFMREYIQYILLNDFGLVSCVTDRSFAGNGNTGSAGSNFVTVKAEALKEWCKLSR
jgi:hypothetical protein